MEILLIEGELGAGTPLASVLTAAGFRVARAENGREGLELALGRGVDLVVLELMPSGIDGLYLLRTLHTERPDLPVILLSRSSDLPTKIRAFELGASDVLERPFSLDELVARVRVHVRSHRERRDRPGVVRSGKLTLDLARQRALVGSHCIDLTCHETRLLAILCEHCGEVVSRDRLLAEVWNYHFDPGSNVVAVCIGRLRKKLGPEAPIETVRRAGYRLSPV
jgi:DNA-binding response OmpR family regulator